MQEAPRLQGFERSMIFVSLNPSIWILRIQATQEVTMRFWVVLAGLVFLLFFGGLGVFGQSPADVQKALVNEKWAWNDHGPCTRVVLCATYFDSFGLNINFSDGSVVPFAHVQRLTTSAHDCIQNAKNALAQSPPDRGLAVEWVMASQIHNKPLMDWMRTHPDAVVAALPQVH